jgi:hypothetical protein
MMFKLRTISDVLFGVATNISSRILLIIMIEPITPRQELAPPTGAKRKYDCIASIEFPPPPAKRVKKNPPEIENEEQINPATLNSISVNHTTTTTTTSTPAPANDENGVLTQIINVSSNVATPNPTSEISARNVVGKFRGNNDLQKKHLKIGERYVFKR